MNARNLLASQEALKSDALMCCQRASGPCNHRAQTNLSCMRKSLLFTPARRQRKPLNKHLIGLSPVTSLKLSYQLFSFSVWLKGCLFRFLKQETQPNSVASKRLGFLWGKIQKQVTPYKQMQLVLAAVAQPHLSTPLDSCGLYLPQVPQAVVSRFSICWTNNLDSKHGLQLP